MARSVLRICSRISCGFLALARLCRSTAGSLSTCASSGLFSMTSRICGFASIIERSSSGLSSMPCIMGELIRPAIGSFEVEGSVDVGTKELAFSCSGETPECCAT